MANITLPNSSEPMGTCTCPNCGKTVTLKVTSAVWIKFFSALQTIVNQGIP